LDIRDLTFTYDEAQSPALAGVNLDAGEGDLVLLCGPTGCGKTTLALCLNGLVPHATGGQLAGSVEVGGVNTTRTPTPHMATEVGLVFQDPEGQLCTLFLEDEIAFGPENLRLPRPELASRVDEMLDLIGLQHARNDSVFELSGGQKQKVNIASVLAMQPRLLVLDMPTANLDPVGSVEVFSLIRRLVTEEEVTCLVIENRLDDLVHLADRVVVMGMDGTVAYDGTPAEVFAHGQEIMGRLGVEVPQVVELALALCERGHDVGGADGLPLTVEALAERMGALFEKGELRVRSDVADKASRVPAGAPPIVEMEGVWFAYRRGQDVLKGVSFQMQQGELLAVVGNNGSGKTTLAQQLVGLLRPTAGRAQVCGLDVSHRSVEEISAKVAYVFQYPEHQFVAQGQTVYDEIAFNLRMAGYSELDVEARVADLINRFHLSGREQTSPYALSGGEMRTLSVACMLSTEPELLILDEPTYGQDRQRIMGLMGRLADLRAEGTSVMMITHDMRLVAEYATSVVLLNDGQLLFHGATAELFAQPDLLSRAALKEPPVCAVACCLREQSIPLPPDIITVAGLLAALACER
jgi:energy-coupling factor transport system ATP-binding protein